MMLHGLLKLLTSSLLLSQRPALAASLQPPPSPASSADPLPDPTLSTKPSRHFYYEGEPVPMKCSAPTMRKIGGFRFFNRTGRQIDLQAPFSLQYAFLHLTATKTSAGEYTCMYFVEDSGQEIPSRMSLPLSVQVRDAPPAPTLSLDPQRPLYRPGNRVRLLCSIPSLPAYVREVRYYAKFGLTVSVPVRNVRNHSYDLRIAGEEVAGAYSCAYFAIRSGRPVRSERSRWIHVAVKSGKINWIREIVVGGSFFTINGLIFFFSHRRMKRRGTQG